MQIINKALISNKKVLLRYDIDVAIANGVVTEDFKLRQGLPTLKLCLENAAEVILIGHVGRPQGQIVPELSVEPIRKWFASQGFQENVKFKILENLRFDPRESTDYFNFTQSKPAQNKEAAKELAKELAALGDVYINEAFSSHHPAASTTILPTLLPHGAGLHFAEEIKVLTGVRENPKKPFIAILGGTKVGDKARVIDVLAKKAEAVLVGGKLVAEIREQNLSLTKNVLVGKLSENGFDVASETILAWQSLINNAAEIIWSGPLGKFEDPKNDATKKIAEMILESNADIVIGGGDTVAALGKYALLEKAESKTFVSVGGGAMLKFLVDGTLPTIEALQ